MPINIKGRPIWHDIIQSLATGEGGNQVGLADCFTLVKDCLNYLKLRFTPFPDEFLMSQNWDEGVSAGNAVTAATEAICVCELDGYNQNPSGPLWTGGRRIFVANGNKVYISARGTKWLAEGLAGTPPTFYCIAASGFAHPNAIAAGDTNQIEFYAGATQTWSTITSPRTGHSFALWHSVIGRFLLSCSDGPGNPHIVAYDETGGSGSDLTMPIPAGYLAHLLSTFMPLATSSQVPTFGPATGYTIACNGDTDGTVDLAFYITPNAVIGTAWTLSQPHLTTQSPAHSFFYDAAKGFFYLITQDGHAYSTPDGVTFTDLGYTIPVTVVGLGGVANLNTVSARGDFWYLCTERGLLSYSIDAGETWTQVPAPFVGDPHDYQQFPMQRTFKLVDRTCVVARALSNGTPHQISFTKRLR